MTSTGPLVGGAAASPAHEAAHRFASYLAELERRLKRAGDEPPLLETRHEAAGKFWAFVATLRRLDTKGGDLTETKHQVREILGPWLWRSDYFARAYHRPHGFPGDFRTMELLYDLGEADAVDATKPALVSCLDYCFATLPSVQALWEQRRRIAAELLRAHARSGGRLSVLDVGAGSARYLRDFLRGLEDPSGVDITVVDRDATAVRFLRLEGLKPWEKVVTTHVAALFDLDELVAEPARFDVVLCAGVLDDLDSDLARDGVDSLVRATRRGGLVIATNGHPGDTSRPVNDWILDCRPIVRDEETLAALFPEYVSVTRDCSASLALSYAFGLVG